jgi:hypothetical protein
MNPGWLRSFLRTVSFIVSRSWSVFPGLAVTSTIRVYIRESPFRLRTEEKVVNATLDPGQQAAMMPPDGVEVK